VSDSVGVWRLDLSLGAVSHWLERRWMAGFGAMAEGRRTRAETTARARGADRGSGLRLGRPCAAVRFVHEPAAAPQAKDSVSPHIFISFAVVLA